jgi:nicotinamidase-related amidase
MTTALILVDVINDFYHPRGTNYHPEYAPILANIERILEVARQNQVVIVHAMEGHPPGHDQDFEWRKLPPHCSSGSFESQPAEGIDIRQGEFTIRKRRYSAFFATDLDLVLRERDVNRLVIVGVKTHVCVRATAQDAFGLGYDVAVVREAVGSNHGHLHQASLEDIERYMGHVISMDECLTLFKERA